MNTALLLLEMQNDYFPNGRVPLDRSLETSAKAQLVLRAFRERRYPVIHMQHVATQPNASYFLPGTKGVNFHPNIQPIKGEVIIKKHHVNGFKDTTLKSHLAKHQINHLVVCGSMTHMAIDATVRAGADLGFAMTVLYDACATRQLELNHTYLPAQSVNHAFLAALHPHYASVMHVEEFLRQFAVVAMAVA